MSYFTFCFVFVPFRSYSPPPLAIIATFVVSGFLLKDVLARFT